MSEKLLTHEEFLQQYVLNRALGNTGGLGEVCVDKAQACWDKIQEYLTPPK